MVIVLGDFNAKVLTDPGIPRRVGPNTFTSTRALGEYREDILENRDLFLDFLLQQDLVALNTLRSGPAEEQVTYRYPIQPDFGHPWEENSFAQIDFILTKSRWRNLCSDVKQKPSKIHTIAK